MKSISSYLLRSLCTLMVGLLLILNPDTPTLLIQVIGALFALSGLYAVLTNIISRFSRNAEIRPSFPLVGIGCLLAGVILGIGRAIGETMAVIMVAGNQVRLPDSILKGVRTLTANIVIEMGYAADLHREALIATGVVLFAFILLINLTFNLVKNRGPV